MSISNADEPFQYLQDGSIMFNMPELYSNDDQPLLTSPVQEAPSRLTPEHSLSDTPEHPLSPREVDMQIPTRDDQLALESVDPVDAHLESDANSALLKRSFSDIFQLPPRPHRITKHRKYKQVLSSTNSSRTIGRNA